MDGTSWHKTGSDEAEQFETARRLVNDLQRTYAASNGGAIHRAFHVKSHAGLNATFHVHDDIPVSARLGVFEAPREYPAQVRFSNGFSAAQWDFRPDVRGFAVRLLGVEGPRLLPDERQDQDFLGLNVSYMPFCNIMDFAMISTSAAKNPLRAVVDILRQMGVLGGLRVLLWSLRLLRPISSVATETYFGLLPISVGPQPAKFKWVPHQNGERWPALPLHRDSFRRNLTRRLRAGPLRFDLMVQLFVDAQRTPIERGAYPWKESDAPFIKLGKLTIPKQDLASEEVLRLEEELRRSAFNPWNGIEAHRPLGNTQEGRRSVYQASVALRRGSTEQ